MLGRGGPPVPKCEGPGAPALLVLSRSFPHSEFPQELKPALFSGLFGTTKVVPSQNSTFSTSNLLFIHTPNPSGAKAPRSILRLAARLKSCPDTRPLIWVRAI